MERPVKRVRLVARFAFIWAAIIVFRLFYLQVVHHDAFRQMADRQQERLVRIQPPRGVIFDRTGQRLAMSLPVDSVYVNPLQVPDLRVAAEVLSPILSLDRDDLLRKLRVAVDTNHGFLWIKRKISTQESARLRALKLDWIGFQTESKRFYPFGSLAAHVLGSVDTDENGLGGVELKLNDELEGHPGLMRVTTDVKQRGFDSEWSEPDQPGEDVHLTIDSRIQYIAEQALQKAIVEHHCWTGSIVAMNPKTGDVLALANYPTFDPNVPEKPGDSKAARFDLAVSVPFEPGSMFKVITVSAALETTNLRPQTIIPCGNGVMNMYGRIIHDHESHSALSMEDVLVHSSNIGAINIGLKTGKENLYAYIRRFGFGERTGILLPGESPGVVHPLKMWQPTSMGSIPMGQELMTTTLQLAQAASVIANGGYLVRPRLIVGQKTPPPRRVILPQTAATMREMMEQVVLRGTGRPARLAGYTSGGKTGTAQIVDPHTGRYTHYYNASFMGFAPVENPQIVIIATGNGSTGHMGFGTEVSAPVFKEVAEAALRMLDVPKDIPDAGPMGHVPPDNAVANNNADVPSAGNTNSSVHSPLVPADVESAGQRPFLVPIATANPSQLSGPRTPDFQGKTMRAVMEEATALGIPVEFTGDGLVRAQSPPPGSILAPNESVQVQFGR